MTDANASVGLKRFALHIEFMVVMGLGLVAVNATMFFYSGKSAELLSYGHRRLVSTLEGMEMTDTCDRTSVSESVCPIVGNYRVKKSGAHAWSISELGREAALEGQEVMSVTETGMFINTLVPLKQERRLKREIIETVTGKTLVEIQEEQPAAK